MARCLSARHILLLAKVIEAVQSGRKVRWCLDGGEIMEGTMRGFCDEMETTSTRARDLRDTCVRITTVYGTDQWINVEEIAEAAEDGLISL